jgi:hypothetical protein
MSRRAPLEARTMFLSAAIFAVLLGVIGALGAHGRNMDRKLLETGRRTTVTVLSKQKDSKGRSKSVEIRLDELSGEAPFTRTLLGDQWEQVQPGGKLSYVYDPADPRGGVLGTPQTGKEIGCFFAAGSLLIVPFLIIGIVLKIRERKASGAAA